jgi:hypothetical protein
MAVPDRDNKPYTNQSEQGVLNESRDEKYKVLGVELLVENDTEDALVRLKRSDLGGGGSSSTAYEGRFDTTSTPDCVYIGKATPGTAESASGWQVVRVNTATGQKVYADDVTGFTKQWSARTGYTY